MEWYTFLPLFICALVVVLLLRIPVAFGMLGIGIVSSFLIFESFSAASKLVGLSVISSVNSFTFSAIPLFILMGEVLFRSRIAQDALAEISILMRGVPGRLPMVSVAGGGAFGLLSGSSLANTALFSRTLLPQMRDAGYNRDLAAGSILASGGLAMVLPPSALGILWGGIAQVPIGPLMMAGIIPGILMALGYVIIVLWRSRGDRDVKVPGTSRRSPAEVWRGFFKNLLIPGILALIILGLIFFGVATPTESAALGATASVIIAAIIGRLRPRELWEAAVASVRTTTTIFFLVMASTLYSQIMAYMGATQGLVAWLTESVSNGIIMMAIIIILLVILSAFIDQASIMMITAPLLMPIALQFGWNGIWFSILVLVTLQIGNISPPFGMGLFVMKSTAPWIPMSALYKASIPWIISDLIVVVILAIFPWLVMVIPNLMS
ncbi:Sialic acid TRAP transporter permease protein SiaT [Corynebacterium occultum]|uniref:Sialic acid TRAP transporter permease protein SiaT n=1 Tax=Corynebacterium occultum TaxID=2675219 RepID=A0A6B8W4H0_9CORY|nr:TRAP transporter large permease [Corynebacterium occultum]QGU07421.1 Sialic acid TRAP transporter permease protein SiaT [Corynebacterium occultum]